MRIPSPDGAGLLQQVFLGVMTPCLKRHCGFMHVYPMTGAVWCIGGLVLCGESDNGLSSGVFSFDAADLQRILTKKTT